MREILDGVLHWKAKHPDIGMDVSSYWFRDSRVVLDPMVPAEGLEALAGDPPEHVVLTNRLHRRQQDQYVARFGVDVWAPGAGMHHFPPGSQIKPYDPEQELPGGFIVYEVGTICPDEMALHQPA